MPIKNITVITFITIIMFIFFSFPVAAQETCFTVQSEGTTRYYCEGVFNGDECERDDPNLRLSDDDSCRVVAQGETCQYTEEQNDGLYVCTGSFQRVEGSTQLSCQYNRNVSTNCQKEETYRQTTATQSAQTCRDPKGCDLTPQNYRAPQHSDYTLSNIENSLLYSLVGCKVGGEGGVSFVIENEKAVPKVVPCNPGSGATRTLTNVMVALYQPPTSSVQYLAHLGENLGLIKPAFAQVGGSGAGIINPILSLWQVIRNIAYLAFILIFLVVGLMVMFRQRINPQVVITAQQALPGLAIGLILVTFSYFLAALMVDTAFVGVQLVGQTFTASGSANVLNIEDLRRSSNIFEMFFSTSRLENVGDLMGGIGRTLGSILGGGTGANITASVVIPAIIGAIIGTILMPGGGTLLGIGAGTAIGTGIGAASVGIVSLIIPLILIIALLIQFFRLLWGLISSYIAILVGTITGPLIIMFGSIPGKGGALSMWWKTILGNALVFPAVFAGFLFAGMILGLPTEAFGNSAPPLFGGLSVELLRLILAYGIILGTPAIPGMVKRAMGVPDIQGIPQTAMGAVTAGAMVAQTAFTRGRGRFWRGSARSGEPPTGPWAEWARGRGWIPQRETARQQPANQ